MTHGLRLDSEIHASEFLGGSPSHLGLDICRRFQCAHHILRTLATFRGITFERLAVLKSGRSSSVLDAAWDALLANLKDSMQPRSPGGCPSRGLLIICDHHAATPYRPSEHARLSLGAEAQLLDLPFGRDSADNLLLQAVDLLAYLTKQILEPNAYFSRPAGRQLLRLADALFDGRCPVVFP